MGSRHQTQFSPHRLSIRYTTTLTVKSHMVLECEVRGMGQVRVACATEPRSKQDLITGRINGFETRFRGSSLKRTRKPSFPHYAGRIITVEGGSVGASSFELAAVDVSPGVQR